MGTERLRWYRVKDPRLFTLAEGVLLHVEVKRIPLCFVRLNGVLNALSDNCPHQGARLSGGWCEAGHIVCPWHRFHFDIVTGNSKGGGALPARVVPVRVTDGRIEVALPGRLLPWR